MIHSYYLPILDIAPSEQKEKGENHLCTLYFVFNRLKRRKQWTLSDLSFTPTHTGTDPSRNSPLPGEDRLPKVEGKGTTNMHRQGVSSPVASPDCEVEQGSPNAISQGTPGEKAV